MGSEWKEYKIRDVARVITGKTPPGTLDQHFGGDVLFVTPGDMDELKHISNTSRTLSIEGQKSISRIIFDRGIVVSCIGWQMGKSAIVNQRAATNQQINTVIADESIIDMDFLFYVLKSKREQIFQLGATATRTPIVKKSLFEKISFKAPPLSEQKKISECLSSIDDKIELNRQMNTTLEAMSQALFKSWFVDFDPVIDNALAAGNPIPDELAARAERRTKAAQQQSPEHPHTLPAAIRQQFPDRFVFTETMGWVPEGWKVTSLGQVTKCFDSKRIPLSKGQRESKKPGNIPYYGATSVMDKINEWIFDDIYLLVGEDGSVIKEDGTPFLQYIWGKSWVNNHAHVLQGEQGVSTEHLMLFMACQNMAPYITGAVQLKINQKNLNSIPFLKASAELNQEFASIIAPYFTKIRLQSEEAHSLTELRDTLLPKLLSGQLRIPEAEQLVAEVI